MPQGRGDGIRVWLTHLSSRCWQDIDHSKVYVIGGIVGKSGFISPAYKRKAYSSIDSITDLRV
jgi:hypothetical protein